MKPPTPRSRPTPTQAKSSFPPPAPMKQPSPHGCLPAQRCSMSWNHDAPSRKSAWNNAGSSPRISPPSKPCHHSSPPPPLFLPAIINHITVMKTFLLIVLALAIAIPATWFAAHHDDHPASVSESPERHVKYYQCAMHHQIKSDKPGRCPICGMELTPIYEGVSNTDSDPSIVELSPVSQRVLHVETTTARKVPLVKSLRVAGAIEEDDTRHRLLSAVVDGRIEKL